MTVTTIEASDTLTFLRLEGALDLAGVKEIETQFLALTGARGKPAIVDLSEVTFLASFGMRLLIEAYKELDHAGQKIIILNPQPMVGKVLEAAGMTDVIPVVATEAEARVLL